MGIALACLCLATSVAFAAEAQPAKPALPVLHLLNDGYAPGELRDSAAGGVLRWQSPLFASPFEFSLASVNALHFPPPAKPVRAVGDYCFELERGDVVFGSLIDHSDSELELEVAGIGRVHVQRSSVHRFFRWRDSADTIYLGPQGLTGWKAAPAGAWREEFGHLATLQEGSIYGDFGLPARAMVEFEISWKKKPDFVLALGIGDDDKTKGQAACQFEVWGDDIVVLRDLEGLADLTPVLSGIFAKSTPATSAAGSAHLQVFLDQNQGRCLVFSASGKRLADLKVVSDKPLVLPGIRLENKRGDIRLERLRISHWEGELPQEVQADQPRVHLTDGTIAYGQVTGYDAANRQFVVRGKSGESKVSADRLDSAFLSLPAEKDPAAVRALFHDGTQISGEIVKVADGALWISSATIKKPLRLPVEGLRSVISLRHDSASSEKEGGTGTGKGTDADKDIDGRLGTLELEGLRLRGRLVDGREQREASCLVWQPVGSTLAGAIRPGVSGRIVYKETPKQPPQAAQAAGGAVRVRVAAARPAGAAAAATSQRRVPKGAGQPSLYLLTGDTIPCEVTGIDENGVSFKTSFSDSNFVTHDKIKAVELVRESANSPGLTKVKRDRLLTLPRMQRDSPPTHLIRSRDGDYLRGRLMGMDANRLQVEVRLEMKEIPRERVARIIWLHAEDLDKAISGDLHEGKPAEVTDRAKLSPAEEKIRRSLDAPTDVDFADFPLKACVEFLQENHHIKISIDKQTFEDEGVALDAPITLKLAGVSLRGVLKLMLDPLQSTFVIEDDEIIITTTPKAKERTGKAGETAKSEDTAPFRAPPSDDKGRTRVQVIRNDESRLTFFADSFAEGTLSGTSDVLGPCRVNLAQIDQVLIGGAIEQAAAELAYQKWKLQNAVEPKFVQAGDGADGADAGTESQLVGKLAPAFELDLLAGGRFKLADQKGHVVVLDFWATWCGPCLAAMPQVDRAVHEFKDQGVQLVAVNLEEGPKPIRSMLERHKLDLTVALDRDGVVASKYQATAIPQTVVIDAEGKIVRVFIGGGAHLEGQLRDALKSLFPDNPPQQPAP